MTEKQLRFVEYFIQNGGNGSAAARAAGYRGNSATLAAVAHENLNKPDIRDAVARRRSEFRAQMTVTIEAKRQRLWAIANECKQSDPMAAIRAIIELNRMDGDYQGGSLSGGFR